MTIVNFRTHLTTDPVFDKQSVTFNVLFGDSPIFCFTNRADVVSYIKSIELGLGDSVEMTATLVHAQNDYNHPRGILKVVNIEIIDETYIYRKRKIDAVEVDKEDPLPASSVNKKMKQEHTEVIAINQHTSPPSKNDDSINGIFVIEEYKGSFIEYHYELKEKVDYYRSQQLEVEEIILVIEKYLERLWRIFDAIQKLSDDDEISLIFRLVEVAKEITFYIDALAPKFEENDNHSTSYTVFLPSYIFEKYMSISNKAKQS